MKEFSAQLAHVSSGERLLTTLFFAVLLHGIVILGVTFSGEEAPSDRGSTLEITLVNTQSRELPDDADYLADASQQGGGNTKENVRPQAAMSSPELAALDGTPDASDVENRLEAQAGRENPDALETPQQTQADKQVVTRAESSLEALTEAAAPAAQNERVLVARLMTPGNELTEPVNDANSKAQARSKNLREKVIAVNTRESVYARYLDEWRRQVERVGNANYPDEARRQNMEGSLVLEVSLNSNGTIRELDVRRKSQHPLLDDAAMRILRLAAPFPPFTEAMRTETDVLRFVYVWRFGDDGATSTVRAAPDSSPDSS
ncbi:MAG TPA: TonB family protein [Gammaproteobacteria bacterium]